MLYHLTNTLVIIKWLLHVIYYNLINKLKLSKWFEHLTRKLTDFCSTIELWKLYFLWKIMFFINPVQLPLHEPYFDLTSIKITHTKEILNKIIYKYIKVNTKNSKLIAYTFFDAWRVVSTHLRCISPWRNVSRLLVIPFSYSQISDYNPKYLIFRFS